jgi:hypothetical protein
MNVGAHVFPQGRPKGKRTPSGGSAAHEVASVGAHAQFQMFHGVCIQMPTTISHTRVTGMKIFQPRRMIWS